MGMTSGESGMYFGRDVGKWGAKGAGNFLLLAKGGQKIFYPMCLHSKCSDFCGEFKYG